MARVIAVRDDGPYDGYTAEELSHGALAAFQHPSLDGWLLIDHDGLRGSDVEDVEFELALSRFETRIQEDSHEFVPVAGHLDDDECTHRGDGTDATYCGLSRRDHISALNPKEQNHE